MDCTLPKPKPFGPVKLGKNSTYETNRKSRDNPGCVQTFCK